MCYHNLLQLWLLQIAANVVLQFAMAGTSLQITTGVTIHNGTLTCKYNQYYFLNCFKIARTYKSYLVS